MKFLFILLLTAGIVSAQTVTTTAPANMLLNDYKVNVRVATTANITIATALNTGDTIDGVTLAANDRVLVKSQSTASQNGIYVVSASPARASDSNSWAELPGAVVVVTSGTTNGDTFWINTSSETGTVGSTSISYSQITGGGGGGLTGSTGGNGAADSGKAALFDAGGVLTSSDGFNIVKSSGGYGASFDPDSLTAARAFSFPDASGVLSTSSSTETLTNKRITARVATLTDAATVTLATDNYDGGILNSLSQATNFANPTGTPTDMQSYVLRVKSTTARALTWGSQFHGGGDIALPTTTTGSSKTDYFKFTWDATESRWDITARPMGY